ncbi:hypothetical protein P3G22_12425, partial [Rhodopseudomonas sp. BAL398]|nr:hypothetical protein [Rhodopseudomonas sp. BAL398]
MIPLSLRDRLLGLRDALRSSARFQRFAAAFPLTRRVGRGRARGGVCVGGRGGGCGGGGGRGGGAQVGG